METFNFIQMQLLVNRAYAFGEADVPCTIEKWKAYFKRLGYWEISADVWGK